MDFVSLLSQSSFGSHLHRVFLLSFSIDYHHSCEHRKHCENIQENKVMFCIMTFQSMPDQMHDGGSIDHNKNFLLSSGIVTILTS